MNIRLKVTNMTKKKRKRKTHDNFFLNSIWQLLLKKYFNIKCRISIKRPVKRKNYLYLYIYINIIYGLK